MPFGDIPNGVPLDRRPSQIQVQDIRLLVPSGLTFSAGGCDQSGCVLKAELIDLPRSKLYLIPITLTGATQMLETLSRLVEAATNPERNTQ